MLSGENFARFRNNLGPPSHRYLRLRIANIRILRMYCLHRHELGISALNLPCTRTEKRNHHNLRWEGSEYDLILNSLPSIPKIYLKLLKFPPQNCSLDPPLIGARRIPALPLQYTHVYMRGYVGIGLSVLVTSWCRTAYFPRQIWHKLISYVITCCNRINIPKHIKWKKINTFYRK